MTRNLPYLIVGHGIAGAMVAFTLFQRNIPFHVIDEGQNMTSSKVSSGLINPITGRYFARSWMIEETLPFSKKVYREIEDLTGVELLRETSICRVLRSVAQENEWASKMQREAFGKYMDFWTDVPPFTLLDDDIRLVRISPVLQLRSSKLIDALRNVWKASNRLIENSFEYQDLSILQGELFEYNGETYRGVIFCEGYQVMGNPYFKDIPIEPTKGEVILVRIKGNPATAILKHHCFIIPWEDDLYWIGSNYEKFPGDVKVNMKIQSDLEDRLHRSIAEEFEVVERWTGIRPASNDRRPIIGGHPVYQGMYIFNGLGTKGTVYAPYFAAHLTDHLISDSPILKEVALSRW